MSGLASLGLRLNPGFWKGERPRARCTRQPVIVIDVLSGLATCMLALLGLTVFVPGAAAGFIASLNTPAGIAPSAIAVGDFNEDGVPDLVVVGLKAMTGATSEPGQAMLLFGKGDGSFQAGPKDDVGARLLYVNWQVAETAVAVGDFNRDGHLDLVVANSADGSLSVLLGDGDGTFQAPENFRVGPQPTFIAVGDFNGDGYPDLAVTISGRGTVSIFLGNGDGTFQTGPDYAVAFYTACVAVGDFNGDGILDLAVTNNNSAVSILLGNGDGTFQAAVNFPAGPRPQYLAVGDFNGDSHLDIAVANFAPQPGEGMVSILLGNGDGTFQPAESYAAGSNPDCLAVGDFDRDGNVDLVVGSRVGARILLGKGDGSFQTGQLYGVGAGPVAVVDLNQDGHEDVAVIDSGSPPQGVLSVLLGNGDGTFFAAPTYPVGKGFCGPLAVGDFNGDGIADLAVAVGDMTNDGLYDGTNAMVVIWFGKGDGTFREGPSFFSGSGTLALAVADFNGDGKADLLVTNNYWSGGRFNMVHTSDLRVFLGNGDGTFQNALVFPADIYPPFPVVAIGDFNVDGKADLALVTTGATECTVNIWLGKGDGTFQLGPSYQVAGHECRLATGDFNGDGILDLAVEAADLTIFLGQGDGTFQAANRYAVQGAANLPSFSLALGDFNGDGFLDIALNEFPLNNSVPGLLYIFLGNGDGSFQAAQTYTSGVGPQYMLVGDFNGDGISDLAYMGGSPDAVSVRLGKGDGTLGDAQNFTSGSGSVLGWMATGDFNGDGKPDIAVANTAAFSILLNDGHWAP